MHQARVNNQAEDFVDENPARGSIRRGGGCTSGKHSEPLMFGHRVLFNYTVRLRTSPYNGVL